MNYTELHCRLANLEAKVEKLTPTIGADVRSSGSEVSPISTALGIQLIGLTNAQRTALGVQLATLPAIKYIFVYDTEDQTYYIWNGSEWV